jgi:hypothetical protein
MLPTSLAEELKFHLEIYQDRQNCPMTVEANDRESNDPGLSILGSGSIRRGILLVVVQIVEFDWTPFSLSGKLGINKGKNLG